VEPGSSATRHDVRELVDKASAAGDRQPHEARRPLALGGPDIRGSGLQNVSTWLGIVGMFAAPTTLVTAACYYVGSVYTHRYFAFFGIASDAIGFTTTDYVISSINVIMVPTFLLLIGVGLWMIADAYARRMVKVGRQIRLVRAAGWIAIAIGTFCTLRGVFGLFLPQLFGQATLTPAALGLGTILVVYGFRMLATSTPSSSPRPFAAIGQGGNVMAAAAAVLALLWSANLAASARAEATAKATAHYLWDNETAVVVDTSERLIVPSDLIKETQIPSADPALAPTFHYECFRALQVRGDRWALVSAKWTPSRGYAVIITASATTSISTRRLEGISARARANRSGDWQCPEVGPYG
jgi:hypothetical protein